jgi:hypothetical protein
MCRNIHTLYHIDPPATPEQIQLAALQYVRKVSGFRKPSRVNETAFLTAVDEIAAASAKMLASLQTNAHIRDQGEVYSNQLQVKKTNP